MGVIKANQASRITTFGAAKLQSAPGADNRRYSAALVFKNPSPLAYFIY